MIATSRHSHTHGYEPGIAPSPVADEANADIASELELKMLQDQITSMRAAALRLEEEIKLMLAETNGAATSSSEYAHAKQAAHNMFTAAEAAKSAITNAPTDPQTGRKIISSKRVATLSNGIANCIVGAEKEGAKVDGATAETKSHTEIANAKAKAAASAPAAKPAIAALLCSSSAPACKATTAGASLSNYSWFHEKVTSVQNFGARITDGFGWGLQGVASTISNVATSIANADPIGKIKAVASGAATVVQNGFHALGNGVSYVTEAVSNGASYVADAATSGAKAVVTGVSNAATAVADTVSNAASVVADSVSSAASAVADTVSSAASTVSTNVASAFNYLNPFKSAPVKEEPKVAAAEIRIAPGTMEKALGQAKGMMGFSLPHLSMPNLSDFIPTPMPFAQGLTAGLAAAN